jgi:hypothetical protein
MTNPFTRQVKLTLTGADAGSTEKPSGEIIFQACPMPFARGASWTDKSHVEQ